MFLSKFSPKFCWQKLARSLMKVPLFCKIFTCVTLNSYSRIAFATENQVLKQKKSELSSIEVLASQQLQRRNHFWQVKTVLKMFWVKWWTGPACMATRLWGKCTLESLWGQLLQSGRWILQLNHPRRLKHPIPNLQDHLQNLSLEQLNLLLQVHRNLQD